MLSRLSLRITLTLLLGLSALAVVTAIAVGASSRHATMMADRADKLRAVVRCTVGIATNLEKEVAAQHMTGEQALARLCDTIPAMRFDDGPGSIAISNADTAMVVVHGANPALENAKSTASDEHGHSVD